MSAKSAVQSLRKKLHTFSTAEAGNVVLTFALLSLPLLGMVGASIDYSRANLARSAMQSALDATALLLSKEAAVLSATELSSRATDIFKGLYNRPDVSGITISPTYSASGGSELVVTGSGILPTSFIKVMG